MGAGNRNLRIIHVQAGRVLKLNEVIQGVCACMSLFLCVSKFLQGNAHHPYFVRTVYATGRGMY